ncbi:MAG: P1 family peptidase, partial [Rubrivivax sp.]
GHWTCAQRPTGCTVVLLDGDAAADGAVAGVAQRGGAPGTRETDLLRPENAVERVHAVLLTGGSAFGLDAAGGVMRWLEARGRGLRVGPPERQPAIRVPIVPAAVLFDLFVGDHRLPGARPDADAGWAACEAAGVQAPAEGNVGAGAGATVGKLLGWRRAMKGGIGQASLRVGPITVAAMVAANPIGDVRDAQGQLLAGARLSDDGLQLADLDACLRRGDHGLAPPLASPAAHAAAENTPGAATTIGIVATNARLTKAQCTQLASLAHAGLARAISPLTPHDGDTLFALSVPGEGPPGANGPSAALPLLGAWAADCVARAIRRAVLQAQGLQQPFLPSAADVRAGAQT